MVIEDVPVEQLHLSFCALMVNDSTRAHFKNVLWFCEAISGSISL